MSSLFVAWRPATPQHAGWRPVGRLEHEGGLYRFCYTRGARKAGFRPFARMEQLDETYESEQLFPLFANRLLSESRPEYEAYLRWSGFDIEHVERCEVDFIQLHVARVNSDAPLQNRVLCRMHACWPDGFEPCSGEDFSPIPANLPGKCLP